jgi:hypothetical protein
MGNPFTVTLVKRAVEAVGAEWDFHLDCTESGDVINPLRMADGWVDNGTCGTWLDTTEYIIRYKFKEPK